MSNIEFNESTHTYTVAGRVVPSVTQLLGAVGVRKNDRWCSISKSEWCANDTAANFGKALHAIAVYELSGVEYDCDPAMKPWIDNLKKFFKANELKGISIEDPLYSKIYHYCGTPDLFCMMGLRMVVVDWKTATAEQDHWRMQLAAYAQLLKEHHHLTTLPETWTVSISDTGYKIDKRSKAEVQYDMNRFLSVLNVYKLAA